MGNLKIVAAKFDWVLAQKLISGCPFKALELKDGKLEINAGCKLCRLCLKSEFNNGMIVEEKTSVESVDKSQWRGIAVYVEIADGAIHPVSLELIGKARELAAKIRQSVYAVIIGSGLDSFAGTVLRYGVGKAVLYDQPEFADYKVEPFTAAMEDFIRLVRPAAFLVGGTPIGRALAPRCAARFQTGLTADCTMLDIKENTDLQQIRPAFGGNIMAHINTPNHRPQFATVRYKIFDLPKPVDKPDGVIVKRTIPAEKLKSGIEILEKHEKVREHGIEDAEVLVAAGRGVKNASDLAMLQKLADLLGGELAGTRCMIESGALDHKRQIGLSGRTVKPKLLIACGVSGAIQFVAGMKNSGCIVAINTDPEAPIFKVANICIHGDLYEIVPKLIEKIERRARGRAI